MKIFQIHNGFCWWDATATVGSIENASTMFPPDCVFVEAPDFVFEGWGYDEHAEGDERFIQPETPDGWDYDTESGTFSLKAAAVESDPAERLADMIAEMKDVLTRAEALLAELTPKEDEKR